MKATTRLRTLLNSGTLLMAPGVADAVNARLVREAGFDAIYMTGAGTTASRLGMPDVGLLTMTEMVDNAGRIADASGLPLISDADTGYGGPANVARTVRAHERAGTAGIHLEDQQSPKRCGHFSGKTLVPVAEAAAKIRAAVDSRTDPDFVIIARTDAIAVEGFDAALDRARAYEAAGADVIFVEAPTTMEQCAAIPKAFKVPALFNMASSGKTPFLPADQLQDLGYRLAIYPNFLMLAAIVAARRVLSELKRTGTVAHIVPELPRFNEFVDLMGMKELREFEERYVTDPDARAGY